MSEAAPLDPAILYRVERAISGEADFAFVQGLFCGDVRALLEAVRCGPDATPAASVARLGLVHRRARDAL